MEIRFNTAQLSRPQQKSLAEVLNALQAENESEVVVTPIEFPIKLLVMLDDNIGIRLCWDAESECYGGPTEPESPNKPEAGSIKPFVVPESKQDTVDLPKTEPEPSPGPEPLPTSELVKSEVGRRVEALALTLVRILRPLDIDQRCEVWIQFTKIVIKELIR